MHGFNYLSRLLIDVKGGKNSSRPSAKTESVNKRKLGYWKNLNGIGFFKVIMQFSCPIWAHKLVSALCSLKFLPFLLVFPIALSKPILPANCQRSALDLPESFKLLERNLAPPGGQSVLV